MALHNVMAMHAVAMAACAALAAAVSPPGTTSCSGSGGSSSGIAIAGATVAVSVIQLQMQLMVLLARLWMPAAWSGPEVKAVHGRAGLPMLTIDGQAAPAHWLVVHSLGDAGNVSTPPYTAFDIQIAGAASAGIRLVEMPLTGDCCLETQTVDRQQITGWLSDSHPLNNVTRAALDRAIELHPKVLFFLRFYAQQPDPAPGPPGPTAGGRDVPGVLGWGDLDDVCVTNGNGSITMTCNTGGNWCTRMNSVTRRWTREGRARITTMLSYMDGQYPGRVAGVRPTMLATGEWDLPQPRPFDGLPTLYGDYSEAQKNEFCEGTTDPGCHLPSPDERQSVTMGEAQGEPMRMNLFLQAQIAHGIAGLAQAAKEASNGSLFTMSYYGYDTAVMSHLLLDDGVDGLSTVYEYKPVTRNFSGPLMLPWMLMDGMAAAGKMMLVEDDTRTVRGFFNDIKKY